MTLLVYISNHRDSMTPILQTMADRDIHGATTVDCEGMLQSLCVDSVEPPPIFYSLRQFLNPQHEPGKMLFVVLEDDQVDIAKRTIHEIAGSLEEPNSGIMFTIPVSSVEGVNLK